MAGACCVFSNALLSWDGSTCEATGACNGTAAVKVPCTGESR